MRDLRLEGGRRVYQSFPKMADYMGVMAHETECTRALKPSFRIIIAAWNRQAVVRRCLAHPTIRARSIAPAWRAISRPSLNRIIVGIERMP